MVQPVRQLGLKMYPLLFAIFVESNRQLKKYYFGNGI